MHANQLHFNLSNCAHMYFRPNFNYIERIKCARSECYDSTLTLSVNGQKVKQVDKLYTRYSIVARRAWPACL